MAANQTRPSKAERREAARKAAQALAAKQAATDRRNRLIIIGASVLVVLLVIAAGVIIFRASQKTLLSDFDGTRPEASTATGGITFGADMVAGTVNEGATELDVYLDFMCPGCGQFDQLNRDDIAAMVSDGTVTLNVHPLEFLNRFSMGTEYSSRSANAFATVANDSPEHAIVFMEALFDNQPAENTEGLSDEQMVELAIEVGVPQEVADSFTEGTFRDWVAVASEQSTVDGVTGTPTVFIDGSKWAGNWGEPGALLAAVQG
ncbi:MAG: DsbA family protein [Beutenbergiaceae bacterium]